MVKKKSFIYTFLLAAALFACNSRAAFTYTVSQVGLNIAISGSGSLNLSALTFEGQGRGNSPSIFPALAILDAGPVSSVVLTDDYTGASGPIHFGNGEYSFPATGSGDVVAIADGHNLAVPGGYVSGTNLSDSDIIPNETLAYVGLTPGSYIYTWGSGQTADSLTVNVIGVPEPVGGVVLLLSMSLSVRRRPRV